MSNLREKAREIKAAGEATRGEFTPSGVPLRVYQYWAKRSKNAPERENFCHYWRVVMFWAPFMALRHKTMQVIDHPGTIVGLVLAVVAAVIWMSFSFGGFGQVVLIILASAAAFAITVSGVIGGIALSLKGNDTRRRYDFPTFKPALAMSIVGLPFATASFTLSKAIQAFQRYCLNFVRKHAGWIGAGTAIVGTLAFYGGIAVTEGLMGLLIALGITVGALATVAGLVIGGAWFGDFIKAKRTVLQAKAAQAREDYYEEHGKYPEAAKREPGKADKFFRGLGDFLILLGQVVRVNKWKICPTVDISTVVDK